MVHIEDLDAKHALFKEAEDLARWEYKYLDNVGDTSWNLFKSGDMTTFLVVVKKRRRSMVN